MNLNLTVDEALVLRSACYLHTATCAVNREDARREQNRRAQAYWSERHDLAKALGDRLEVLLSAATSTADPPGNPTPLVGSGPSVGVAAEPSLGGPGDRPRLDWQPAGDTGCDLCGLPKELADPRVRLCNECRASMEELTRACDSCGSPLRTDETVPLCPPCRTKLRQVLAEEVL